MVHVSMQWNGRVEWVWALASGAAGELCQRWQPRTLYAVLELPPEADEQQIKAAYRGLARRFHPDVNAGDAASAGRLAEINEAYATLGNRDARAAYDRDLVRRRAELQRWGGLFAAVSLASFVATAILVSLVARWYLQAVPAGASAPELGSPASPVLGQMADSAPPPLLATPAQWTTYRDRRFDFALRYPAGIFVPDAARSDANTHTFVSRRGSAVLRIVAAENTYRVSLASLRRSRVKERYAGASFDKMPSRRFWFALSGTRGDEVFLERVTFSCDGKSMHGWQMTYPASQRAVFDQLAQLVLRNDPHGNGPGSDCDQRSRPQSKSAARHKRG